ncbi:hypothetical protein ACLB2K_048837 [Fragaria x ananassa]
MEGTCKSALNFFSDQQLCYADFLTPPEVIARIQVAVLNFLKILTSPDPAISGLPLIVYASQCRQGLYQSVELIVWKAMAMCCEVLGQGKRVTQRELFYKLLCDSPEYFSSQSQVNLTIQDVVALLRCSRYSLGIMASSRGLIAGRLLLQVMSRTKRLWTAACGFSGHAITGDLNMIDNLMMKTDALYIIVVEKHLVEDRVFNQFPSILITAKGYPDIATRLLLHRLSRAFPDLPILALVDWNPAGLAILCTFKFGSIGMGLEAYRYGTFLFNLIFTVCCYAERNYKFKERSLYVLACNVKWLGMRADDIELLPAEALVPLKPKDIQIAKGLMSSDMLQESYREELRLMVESGQRAEIEALYCHGYDYLGKFMAKKIVQANYI